MKWPRALVSAGLLIACGVTAWLAQKGWLLYRHFNGELDPRVREYTLPIRAADPYFYLMPMGLLVLGLLLIAPGHFRRQA